MDLLQKCPTCDSRHNWCLRPKGNKSEYIYFTVDGVEKQEVEFPEASEHRKDDKLYCRNCGERYPGSYKLTVIGGNRTIINIK